MTDSVIFITAAFVVAAIIFGVGGYIAAARGKAGEIGRLRDELNEAEAGLEEAREDAGRIREDLREATVRAARATELEEKLEQTDARLRRAEQDLESIRSRAEERDRAHQEKVETLVAFRQDMEKEFRTLADQALEKQSKTFAEANQERVGSLLNPLKEQIDKFEKTFKADGESRASQASAIKTMMETLSQRSELVWEEAQNLTKALQGSSKMQGEWGELILQTILEKSGLREGEEFHVQASERSEEGQLFRPDVLVNFPKGEKLVIDSKVSLNAYKNCANCNDEAEYATYLKQHLESVRAHIRNLGSKDYSTLYGGVNFVILFVPIEGALSLAIQHDPDLVSDAVSQNITIASPNILLMGLRTVENLWTRERQNRNAEAIALEAGKLYDKIVLFTQSFQDIGKSLESAQGHFDKAKNQLSTGRGNVIGRTEKLKKMGAAATKSLPTNLTALSHYDGDDEDGEAETSPALPGGEDS